MVDNKKQKEAWSCFAHVERFLLEEYTVLQKSTFYSECTQRGGVEGVNKELLLCMDK
jgi:hypothetical protein